MHRSPQGSAEDGSGVRGLLRGDCGRLGSVWGEGWVLLAGELGRAIVPVSEGVGGQNVTYATCSLDPQSECCHNTIPSPPFSINIR